MTHLKGLSVAICTRNRHEDLQKCLDSIYAQKEIGGTAVEILIIDDGDTSAAQLERFRKHVPGGMELLYFRKDREKAGLLRSRIFAVRNCTYDTLLFLDDDVVLQDDYFAVLIRTFTEYPDAVGISGADQGFRCSLKGRMAMLATGRGGLAPGKLSPSGFASGMNLWNRQKAVFETEYLHGCNMCYRKYALEQLEEVDWLNGYSLGEDLFLSFIAGSSGKMYVNPALKLVHYGSPASRDKEELVAYTKVVNHYELLKLRTGMTWFRYLTLSWTVSFLYAETLLTRNKEACRGYRRGLRQLRSTMTDDIRTRKWRKLTAD